MLQKNDYRLNDSVEKKQKLKNIHRKKQQLDTLKLWKMHLQFLSEPEKAPLIKQFNNRHTPSYNTVKSVI